MSSQEGSAKIEKFREVPYVLVFDVDGVLTDPKGKKNTRPEIFSQIISQLKKGEPVALNTGRSISWMQQRVISPLLAEVEDKTILRNFLAVGEKGGAWITYSQEGLPQEFTDGTICIPHDLQNKVRVLIQSQFPGLMFYDESKLTMISTEMLDGANLEEYHSEQQILTKKLKELIKQHDLGNQLEVDPTTIATDIQNKHVGKDFAARRILEWVNSLRISPNLFITLGDSKSDVPMAREIYDQGHSVSFVFVGKEEDAKYIKRLELPFTVEFTNQQYENGTLEYLQKLAA